MERKMEITVISDRITHKLKVTKIPNREGALYLFKRLLMSIGYQFDDDEARDIIMCSDDLLEENNE